MKHRATGTDTHIAHTVTQRIRMKKKTKKKKWFCREIIYDCRSTTSTHPYHSNFPSTAMQSVLSDSMPSYALLQFNVMMIFTSFLLVAVARLSLAHTIFHNFTTIFFKCSGVDIDFLCMCVVCCAYGLHERACEVSESDFLHLH